VQQRQSGHEVRRCVFEPILKMMVKNSQMKFYWFFSAGFHEVLRLSAARMRCFSALLPSADPGY
jgi:hypothetical protein